MARASSTLQVCSAAPSLAERGELDDAGQLGQLRQHVLRRQLIHAQRHDRIRARRRAADRHEAAPQGARSSGAARTLTEHPHAGASWASDTMIAYVRGAMWPSMRNRPCRHAQALTPGLQFVSIAHRLHKEAHRWAHAHAFNSALAGPRRESCHLQIDMCYISGLSWVGLAYARML